MDDKQAPTEGSGNPRTTPLFASSEASYDVYPLIEEEFQQFLDGSLNPRGPGSLFDIVATLEVPADGVAIDVGCGEGQDAIELARRFGLCMHGIDPVPRNIELASSLAAAEGLSNTVEFHLGTAEALPISDEIVHLVWCKEVLTLTSVNLAFSEFRRVLRPGGVGFVYQVLTGPKMSDDEAREFWEKDLGYGQAHSVRPSDVEAVITSVGLELRQRIDFASEWGEYAQERTGAGGRRLVHTARLLRDPQRYVERFGESAYRVMLGDCLWHVYRMIGKLVGAAFVFTKPA
jgi:SAM-dependent methyltransferase